MTMASEKLMATHSKFTWDPAKRPNTFVIGAPKCGTTALCSYLEQHPNVFMSQPKESHHFVAEEMPGKARKFASKENYARIFDEVGAQHNVVAEGSVWYMYSQTAVENISKFDPSAKIILMFRRPDEMVYSMHQQAVVNFSEDIIDFDRAWETALAGNKRRSWSKLCDERSKLDYHRIALFSEQLERVFTFFPKDQVHIIFYDDFKSSTQGCFQEVLKFLAIDDFEVDIKKVNESKVVVNKYIGKFLTKPPNILMKLNRIVKKVFGLEKLGFRKRLISLNTRVQKREPLNTKTRADIINYYREDITKLGLLCQRDLSHWLK